MADLRAFLEQLALDPELRAALVAAPDATLALHGVEGEAARVLKARGDDWLGLIGQAVRAAPGPSTVPAPSPDAPVLPEVRVLLRLAALRAADPDAGVQWAVSLHPWPPPAPDPGAAGFLVRVVPRATSAHADRLEVAYTASIQPEPADTREIAGAPPPPSAWGHRADTPAARAAAAAVLDAPPADRLARLHTLIAVVTGDAP